MKPLDDTTDAIVAAALALFGRQGFAKTSIDEVARTAARSAWRFARRTSRASGR